MEQLSVVGQTPEGDALLLQGAQGVKYVVPIDAALRAALRGDRPGLERAKSEGELRPRDIQAAIRAGASIQRVANDSGLSVEHVTRYAAPVLDERAFVAEQARALPIGPGDDSPTLGELIPARLAHQNVSVQDLDWDAWRGPDGWMVACTYFQGEEETSASWKVDLAARSLEPADAVAHVLSAPESPDGPIPRRLRAVGTTPVFDFAALSPADIPAAPEVEEEEESGDTSSLLDELAQQRGQRVQLDLDEMRFPDGPTPEQGDAKVLRFTARRKRGADSDAAPEAPDTQTPLGAPSGPDDAEPDVPGPAAPPSTTRPTPPLSAEPVGAHTQQRHEPAVDAGTDVPPHAARRSRATSPEHGAPDAANASNGAGTSASRPVSAHPAGSATPHRVPASHSTRSAPTDEPTKPTAGTRVSASNDDGADATPDAAPDAAEPEQAPEATRASSRTRRAKVPSWNEIVFGTTPQE